MPVARVQMPDGRIARLEVPEGTTPEQVTSFLQTQASEPRSEIARQLGLTVRHAAEGLAGVAGIAVNPINAVISKATGAPFESLQDTTSRLLTKAGLPQTETPLEDVVGAASRAVAGGGAFVKAGQAIQELPGAVSAVGRMLAANPGAQATSAVTGAASSEVARQKGVGPVGQAVAGVVGGLAPAAVTAAGPMAVRGAFRGGEAGRKQVADNLKTFEDVGTTPTVGQATEGRVARSAESLLSRVPGGAGPIVRKAEDQAEEIGSGLDAIASRLSPKRTAAAAGQSIERGISGEGGFVDRFKARSRSLYDDLDKHISADSPVTLSRTGAVLDQLSKPIPGAMATSKALANPKLASIQQAVKDDLASAYRNTTPVVYRGAPRAEDKYGTFFTDSPQLADGYTQRRGVWLSPGESPTIYPARLNMKRPLVIDALGKRHDNIPVPWQKDWKPKVFGNLPKNAVSVEGAAAYAKANGYDGLVVKNVIDTPDMTGKTKSTVYAIFNEGQAVPPWEPGGHANGSLPYEAVKALRTRVGEELADSALVSDMPRAQLKKLYGALTSDLEATAAAGGPKASAALRRANNYYRSGMARLDVLDRVIDKNGGPEAVFRAATSGTKEGATVLRSVMQSLPKDNQRDLAAAMVRRLGRAVSSKQDAGGETFSSESFLTNWNNLSVEAKSTLFDRFGPRFKQDMNRVAQVAANLRQGSKVYSNPSGTSQGVAQASTATAFILSVLSGNLGGAAAIAGGVGSANVASRLMTNPQFVSWLAHTTRVPAGALNSQVVVLEGLAKRSGNQDMAAAAEALKAAAQPQTQQQAQ